MIEKLKAIIESHPRVLILGFGREGRSTFRLFRKHFPNYLLGIADQNITVSELPELQDDSNTKLFLGENYLNSITFHDLIIKSPGILLKEEKRDKRKIYTSQTDIFLSQFAMQTIGITGTKGKSTTSTLISHFLKESGKNAVLLGNIGIPPFDKLDEIKKETIVVFEMSAHQLEYLQHSPHIAVLLNLFPEHLDHFENLDNYYSAKLNIGKFQKSSDFLIANESLKSYLSDIPSSTVYFGADKGLDASFTDGKIIFKGSDFIIDLNNEMLPLLGEHNVNNLAASMLAVERKGIGFAESFAYLKSFKSLPHRLEYVGKFGGIDFYNDSISTIPESAIAALKSLQNVDTLILGGFDRGIDYSSLIDFISEYTLSNLIFLGKAGEKMISLLSSKVKKQ
ncbi:MAG TPA: UDP-N-acetylmuramoyl-L-alanine--D-glutamate ligase, partial [Bacteroidales bacterium]